MRNKGHEITKKLLSVFLVLCLVTIGFMNVPTTAQGATTIKTSSITNDKLCISKGEEVTLNTGNSKSTFKTSNKKVVSVTSKGVMKGVKKGTATITVKTGSDTQKIKVTVGTITKKITVSKSSVVLEKGKTVSLGAKATPSSTSIKGLTYKSSDKKVATVSSEGKVKGVKKGTATITIKSADNRVSKKVNITVTDSKKANGVTSITTDMTVRSFVDGNGGVIVTLKNGLYGAVNYEGKEIVPNSYEKYWRNVNKDGHFSLGDSEEAYIFDANGKKLFTIKNPLVVQLYNNGVTYLNSGDSGYYDLKNGKEIKFGEFYSITPMKDGKFYVTDDSLYTIDKNKKWTSIQNYVEDGTLECLYRLWFPYGVWNGYGAAEAQSYNLKGLRAGVLSEDGKEMCLVDVQKLFKKVGISKDSSWEYSAYYNEEGNWSANRGKQVVLKVQDDGTERYLLLDFSKAKYAESKYVDNWDMTYKEKLVSNISDIVIADYNYIGLSDSGKYLASDGKSWFYIDEKGKVLSSYVDCSAFYNGYALATKEDGKAYVIDEKFNKVSKGYDTNTVYLGGGVLFIESQNQQTAIIANK